jgi:hypothetical protein
MVYWQIQSEDEIQAELNRLGSFGWELVGTIPGQGVTRSTIAIFVFKKPVQ